MWWITLHQRSCSSANLLNKLVSDVEIGVGHVTFIEELAQVGGYVREWVDGDFIYFIESL